jgi:cytidylate kinase
MKIAIDGPSASGKGTISKILSAKLNAEYLNTGKVYRIIAFLASKSGGNLTQEAIKIAKDIEKHFVEQAQNREIYTEANAKITSDIAKIPELRELLVDFQRTFASKTKNVILEGRDIGTVILPNADFKFFLDASPEERAKRRVLQLQEAGKPANFEEILKDVEARDKNDREREVAGLKIAKNAHYIDTSSKSIDEVVSEMLKIIQG